MDQAVTETIAGFFPVGLRPCIPETSALEFEVDRGRDIRNERAAIRLLAMVAADRGDASKTKALINDFIVAAGVGNELIQRSALAGERDLANELAAELDSRAHRFLELLIASYQCMCGAPFDLTAARKFTELMADAALPGHLYRRLTGR